MELPESSFLIRSVPRRPFREYDAFLNLEINQISITSVCVRTHLESAWSAFWNQNQSDSKREDAT